ncbi:MAG: GNAT family N-acetyltransferase [Pseudomonadota bacterium]
MSIEIRPLVAEEMLQIGALGAYVFGGAHGDDADNDMARLHRPEWTLCAVDDGKLVSSFIDLPFTMRANGRAMPMCGVTVVGTLPEYRRQGLVRRIHTQALENLREAERPVAGLWASQAAIYQRYGYAPTTALRRYAVDSVDIAFHDDDFGSQRVARVDAETGAAAARALYIEFVKDRSLYLHRSKALWLQNVLNEKQAGKPLHIALSYDAAGEASGYIVYSLHDEQRDHPTRNQELRVRDFVWLDPDAYRSLWRFIASHDLVGRVLWERAPLDDPAPMLFREPRLLQAQDREGEWLRLVDARRALAGRGYDAEGRISIELASDAMTPWNDGAFELSAAPDGASTRDQSSGDLRTTARALALLFAGRESATRLRASGLLEADDATVAKADRLFATRHAPHCPDHY